MLPFWGPSTLRDTVALPVELERLCPGQLRRCSAPQCLGRAGFDGQRANLLGASDTADAIALDRYSLVRDFYLQQRDPAARIERWQD